MRQQLGAFVAKETAADLIALTELVEASKVAPVIDRTYSLEGLPAAIRRMQDGQARGKLVVSVSPATTQTPHPGSRA